MVKLLLVKDRLIMVFIVDEILGFVLRRLGGKDSTMKMVEGLWLCGGVAVKREKRKKRGEGSNEISTKFQALTIIISHCYNKFDVKDKHEVTF